MTHQNTFVLTRQPIQYTIWYYYLGTERKHRPELIVCLYYQSENTEQSLKHSTNLHRTLHVPPITPMFSIPKAQKNCRSSERNFKNRPKNHLKSPQNRSKVSKASKIR